MGMREKLIAILEEVEGQYNNDFPTIEQIADGLLANGVTIQRWIPVTERLPEAGDSVLALCWHREAWIPYVCHLSVNFKGRWITNMAGQWMMNVSHWMPLPEPPKED